MHPWKIRLIYEYLVSKLFILITEVGVLKESSFPEKSIYLYGDYNINEASLKYFAQTLEATTRASVAKLINFKPSNL